MPLTDDEKDAIALYVKKLIEEEEERRTKKTLKYTAIAGLFSAALAAAFGWAVLKNAETAAINTVREDLVSKLTTERLRKALDDSNAAIDAASSAKKAATSAQEAAAQSSASLTVINQRIDTSQMLIEALGNTDKFVNDVSNNPALRKSIIDRLTTTLHVSLTPVPGKEFKKGDFWNSENPSHVSYTCPERSVLAGMDFDMESNGSVRSPIRIKYFCKDMGP